MLRRLLLALLVLQAALVLALAGALWRLAGWAPAAALLASLAALLLVRMLITANHFCLGWRHGSATPPEWRLSLAQSLRMYARECWATLTHSSWTMARARAHQRLHPGSPTLPVLLLHGYGCNSGYWARLERRLNGLGISYATLDMEPITGGIDEFVPAVRARLAALCQACGTDSAVIVAHSMGGLVARALLRAHGGAHVARVVTVGTPHHGTRLAGAGPGRNALQMRRASAWLAALHEQEGQGTRALITSIYSHHDNIVTPQSSAHLAGATNIAFGAVGHVALGDDERILDTIIDVIEHSADGGPAGARAPG